MRMTEGKIYLCSWSRGRDGFRVWLKSDPSVAAEHADFEAADDLLHERILLATGDGENQHQYLPPAPEGTATAGRLWRLGPDAVVTMSHQPPYFVGGLCDECLTPLGPRTDVVLQVSILKGGANAARVRLAEVGLGVGPSLTIVSAQVLETFTKSERADFEWRAVGGASLRRAFFEAIPMKPPIPLVLPANREPQVAERCETCGFTWNSYYEGLIGSDDCVSAADLPDASHTLMAVDHQPHARIAVTEARWRELAGQTRLKGIKGSPILIIPAGAVGHPSKYIPRQRAKRAW